MVKRPFALLAGLVLVPIVVVLSLSDSAPGASAAAFERVRSVGFRVIERFGLDVIPIGVPFQPDLVIHLVLWAAVGFIAHRLLGERLPAVLVAILAIAASALFEVGQVLLTTTRSMQNADLEANTLGVFVGVTTSVAYTWVERRLTS